MDKAKEWYRDLRKPSDAPPSWVFGPVWSLLYVLIAISFGFVAYQGYRGAVPIPVLALFASNLVTNLAYSPIQFRLKNLVLASVDVVLVLASLAIALACIYPYYPWVVWINIPYLLWASFATALQVAITAMNRGRWSAY